MLATMVALIGIGVAFVTVWVSHSAKISEFRQAWINELRKDIADYIGAAEKWILKWDEINLLESDEKAKRDREEAFPVANAARVILWRIRLRLNPRENQYKEKDDKLLQSLLDLLDPGKLPEDNLYCSWLRNADAAVETGREILKREWEVTKEFPPFRYLGHLRRAIRL